jgi:hypothetical protein
MEHSATAAVRKRILWFQTGGDTVTQRITRRRIGALFAVPAIVLGLLGMHYLAHPDEGAMPEMGAVSVSGMPDMAAAGTTAIGGGAMESSGTPDHIMMGMACILALLATLFIAAGPFAGAVSLRRATDLGRAIAVGTLAALRPPSLIVLSIRRT